MTLSETILDISREHVRNGGLILGQNVEAVQNVHNSVPVGEPGVVILPTSETAMAGVAIGAALSGRLVIYVLRFSSFTWLQASPLVNYAAIAEELWGYKIPLFVRILAMDGGGPVHTGSMVSVLAHRPGLTIAAPCTPSEYREVWKWFQENRQPIIVSEHRGLYQNRDSLSTWLVMGARATIVGISNARNSAAEAAVEVGAADLIPLSWLSPLENDRNWPEIIKRATKTGRVVVADCSYEPCSIAEHIAYRIASETGAKVKVVGMEPRLSGVAEGLRNDTPSAERIVKAVREVL